LSLALQPISGFGLTLGCEAVREHAARVLGTMTIVIVWLTTTCLLMYYAVLLFVGADRLHPILGGSLYNALIPAGGFVLIMSALLMASLWLGPLVLMYLGVAVLLSRVARRLSMRRRRWSSAGVAAAFLAALLTLPLDGWPWLLEPLLGGDDTEFASTYSPLGFWMIHRGMTSREVLRCAGEPLERYPLASGGEGWRWSRSPHSGNYRCRVVLFADGRVVDKHSECYID
jgi:hypothetical protein